MMTATTLPIKNCFLKNINFCWNPPQNLRQEPLKNEIYASFADSPIIIELICALTGLFSDHYFKMVLPLPCLKLFLGVKKRSPPLLLIFSVTNSKTKLVNVPKIDFIGTKSTVHFRLFLVQKRKLKKKKSYNLTCFPIKMPKLETLFSRRSNWISNMQSSSGYVSNWII